MPGLSSFWELMQWQQNGRDIWHAFFFSLCIHCMISNLTGVRGVELGKVISSLLLFMSLLSRVLLPDLTNTKLHYGRILWVHYFCFTFHISVNGKRAMAVFSLRGEDLNLMILRNLRSWSVALGLFSVYVTAASSSCRSQQCQASATAEWKKMKFWHGTYWYVLQTFFFPLPRNKNSILEMISAVSNWDIRKKISLF